MVIPSDVRRTFPHFLPYSRVLPGEERIHQSILVNEPITGPPDQSVKTVFDVIQRGRIISENGPLFGEINANGQYDWKNYAEVDFKSLLLANSMREFGIDRGQRVGIAGIHSLNYMVAVHALIRSSLVIVPLYHNSKIETLCDIIENCNLELVFCDDEIRANCFIEKKNEGFLDCLKRLVLLKGSPQKCYSVHNPDDLHVTTYEDMLILGRTHQHALIPPEPEDVYIICHTSGTTGHPKGVQLTHRALLAAMAGIYTTWVPPPNNWPFGKEDTYFSFLSLAHIYEHLIQTLTMYFGGRIGIYRGDITKLIQDIQALQPTILSLVPRLLNKFYEHIHTEMGKKNIIIRKIFEKAKKEKINLLRHGIQRYDTIWDKLVFRKLHYLFGGKLRVITTGGAAVNKDVKDFTRIAYGCPLVEGYGQTECAACGTISLPFDTSYGNVGGPAPWAQVKLVDVPELGYFSVEDKGEVCFRGAALMNGYFNEDDLNRKTIDEEGWLHTGDIGQWRGDGRLEIVDRKNALFKLAQGDFVSPESIETAYLNNPLITQIFVTGDTCRSFLVAICVVHYQALKASFINAYPSLKVSQENISADAFLSDEKVIRHLINELNQTGRAHGLQTIELIQEAYLTTAEFTAEGDLLTPTLKLRRHILKIKYADEIHYLYERHMTL